MVNYWENRQSTLPASLPVRSSDSLYNDEPFDARMRREKDAEMVQSHCLRPREVAALDSIKATPVYSS